MFLHSKFKRVAFIPEITDFKIIRKFHLEIGSKEIAGGRNRRQVLTAGKNGEFTLIGSG